MIENAADGFWVVGPTGWILEVNDAYLRRSGYTREEILSKHIGDIEALESHEDVRASIDEVIRRGSAVFEAHHRAKDGTVWPVEVNAVHWRMDGGYFLVFMRDLTGRRHAEAALRTSEEHFRTLYDAIADALVVHELRNDGPPGRFLEVNRVACERLGYTREEMLRMTPLDIDAPDSAVDVNVIGARVRAGETVTFEQIHVAKDGRRIPVEIRAQKFELGGRVHVLSLVRDVTERKHAEEALARENERSQSFLRAASDGIHILDADGYVLEASDSFGRMLGYTREELIGSHVSLWDAQWSSEELKTKIEEQIARQKYSLFETRHRRKDGKVLDVEITTHPLELDGQPVLFNSARDVSERKRAQAERDRFAAIVAHSSDAIVSRDLDWNITSWNASAERLFGYTAQELIGQKMWLFIPPEREDEAHRHDELLHRGEPVVGIETVRIAKDGKRVEVSLNLSPIRNEHGELTGVSLIMRDISERKRVEGELELYRQQLEQLVARRTADLERANRELESFSYSVSHDLRAPLRAINGFAHMLLETEGESVSAKGREHLDRVMRNAGKMGHLIDDILMFSRVSRAELRMGEVDMHALARASLADLKDEYPTTQVRIGALPPAAGDQHLLKQVFSNLINNAFTYSSRKEAPEVQIGAQQQDGETVYFVKDNGAGFDMQHAGQLFGVFRRMHTDAEFPGTGVGLAIVKHILERHGGRVWAEAAVGEGATFYFTVKSAGAPGK